jgi:nucleoside 2-deoxyribosyltransferase
MPFNSAFDDTYKFGIKETAATLEIQAERVDEQTYSESILERIYRQIEMADIVVADMSGKNPNVFYEVGYAHAKGKLCILVTSDANDIPFDLKHRRHVIYRGSIKLLAELLHSELKWALTEIDKIRHSRINVKPRPLLASLNKDKYSTEAEVEFKIDLSNESTNPSPELEAIYFYSSDGWMIYQENKLSPSTDSDLPGFGKRHFISPPLRRFQQGSWAQVQFLAKKTMAYAWKGEELKDSYKLSGRSILRLVTAEGNFDYDVQVDVEAAAIPF